MKIKNLFLGMVIAGIVVGGFISLVSINIVHAEEEQKVPLDGSGGNIPLDGSGSNSIEKNQTFPRISNPLEANNVTEILYTVVDIAIFIGVIIAVLMFIFIGFKFVLAQGNETQLTAARKWFLYAAVGTAILISSKVIVDVIKNTTISAGLVNEQLFKKP